MIITFFGIPMAMLLVEILCIGMLVFAGVSHPFGGVGVGASLGLHPIVGMAVGLWIAFLYLNAYRSRVAAIVLGLLWTLVWSAIGLSVANGTQAQDFNWHVNLVRQWWSAGGDWHRLPGPLAQLKPGIALWYALASVAWHYAAYTMMASPARSGQRLGWTGPDLRQRGRFVVALFFIATLCWLVGLALSST